MSDKKIFGLAGGLFFTAFLLVVVVFTSQITQNPSNVTRVPSKASSATGTVTARLDPASSNVLVGDNFSMNIMINPGSVSIASITTRLSYSYTGSAPEIDVVGNPVGTADLNYIVNSVTRSPGLIIIDVSAHPDLVKYPNGFASGSEFNFATINFVANAPTGSQGKSLIFDQLDSRVIEKVTSRDVLSSTLPTTVVVSAVDNTTPVVSIDATPSLINTRSLNITFSATDNRLAALPYAYSLTGGPTVISKTAYASTGIANLTGLGDGNYVFTAYARDTSNNEGSKSVNFTVDATVPTVTLNGAPSNNSIVTNSTVPAFTIVGSKPSLQYTWSLTGPTLKSSGGWVSNNSVSLTGLEDGQYCFISQVKDSSGNISVIPTTQGYCQLSFSIATKSTLNFSVKFEGMIGVKNADNSRTYPVKSVRIRLMTQGTSPVIVTEYKNITVTPDNNTGIYSGVVGNIVPGTYDIYIKGFAHKQKNFGTATFVAGNTLTRDWSGTLLVAGDIAGSVNGNGPDNLIETSDLGFLINEFAIGVPKVSVADLNGDGKVDTSDLGILIDNFKIGIPGDGGRE